MHFPQADFVKRLLNPKAVIRPSAKVVSKDLKALKAALGTPPAPHVQDTSSDPSSYEGMLCMQPLCYRYNAQVLILPLLLIIYLFQQEYLQKHCKTKVQRVV